MVDKNLFALDGKLFRLGLCQRCGMTGILRPAFQITDADIDSIQGTCSEAIPEKLVCVTCFETPTGIRSANQLHKRLPASEYLLKG